MKVSIIIPSLNSPVLDRVLEKVRSQSRYEMVGEVLIIGKDELQLHKRVNDPRVRFIDTTKPVNAAKARNIGIQQAQHELLLFLDSDCLPEPGWLEEHLKVQLEGHLVVGGGVSPSGTNYWSLTYNLTLFHEFLSTNLAGERSYLPTLNLSVQKKVIDETGLLNEGLSRGQDIDWTTRMKKAEFIPYFAPQAIIHHHHSRVNFKAVWQDCARSGYHMRQVRMQYPNLFKGSKILQNRIILLALSPLVALFITSKIILKHLDLFKNNWPAIPAIYLTKIAWCWGASR